MPTISTKIGGVTIADGEASNLVLDATCDVAAATGAGGGPATELDANGTTLTVDAITDGQFLKRVGTTIVSAAVSGTGDLLSTNNLSDVANAGTSRTNLGLGNVDNTSDAGKPVSTATQTALDAKSNAELFKCLSANENGQNVNTAQPWFPTAGGVTLEANTTYFFEGLLHLSRSAGTTSHTTSLLFGGTATLTSIRYGALVNSGQTAGNENRNGAIGAVATALVVKAASTTASEQLVVQVSGTVRINGAGTFIPQFQYSAAPGGAPAVQANSYFRLWKVGAGNVTSNGTWS